MNRDIDFPIGYPPRPRYFHRWLRLGNEKILPYFLKPDTGIVSTAGNGRLSASAVGEPAKSIGLRSPGPTPCLKGAPMPS